VNLLAIDPGPETCGVVLLNVDEFPPSVISSTAAMDVDSVVALLRSEGFDEVAAERVADYRMKVGVPLFQTCEVYGRIWQRCLDVGMEITGITRKQVKTALGLPITASGAQLSNVIKHTYPQTGGGATPAVGTKSQPGPLYGVKDHAWAALGVGLAWCLERERQRRAAELAALKAEQAPEPQADLFVGEP
jgi:hypothetical protein